MNIVIRTLITGALCTCACDIINFIPYMDLVDSGYNHLTFCQCLIPELCWLKGQKFRKGFFYE